MNSYKISFFDCNGKKFAERIADHIDASRVQTTIYLQVSSVAEREKIFHTVDELEFIQLQGKKIILNYISGGKIVICKC